MVLILSKSKKKFETKKKSIVKTIKSLFPLFLFDFKSIVFRLIKLDFDKFEIFQIKKIKLKNITV